MRRTSIPTVLISAVLFTSLWACSSHGAADGSDPTAAAGQAPAPATPAGPEATAKGVVIATIATQDTKVSILGRAGSAKNNENDLRVIVRKMDGTLIADGVSLNELRAVDPLAHTIVTSALADNGGTFVDATYRAPHASPVMRDNQQGPRTFLHHGL